MKIIFLDIDGVLNDTNPAFFVSYAKRMLRPDNLWNLDDIFPKYVEKLNNIIESTHAKIVISSSWRDKYSNIHIEKMLIMQGFNYPGYIMGATNKLLKDSNGNIQDRGDEIASWLHKNYYPKSFIILDDFKFEHFSQFSKAFIHVPNGLQDSHVDKAIKVLGT